jgi:hypothetical protein
VSSAKIVKDRDSGRSKGFGFVEMPNEEEGKQAIAGLNETELDGPHHCGETCQPQGASRRRLIISVSNARNQ